MPSDLITLPEIEEIDYKFKRVLYGSELSFLIVDDSNTSRTMVERILSRVGYTEVSTAKNGQEGITQLASMQDPVVVLLDINMPVLDGIGFLENIQDVIRSKTKKVVVYIMSTNKRRSTVLRCVELGAKGYLCKPFTPAQLEDKINDVFNFF